MFRIMLVFSAALASPAMAADGLDWDTARLVICANAKWTISPLPGVWDAVENQAELIGLHHVAECRDHPRMAVGQALASIYSRLRS